ncbi:MAG: TerB family tellurite resistance protein [Oligoflexia bacterium]|nr:TerB family tellurite resistance protein [Oligoflexia bacterium]
MKVKTTLEDIFFLENDKILIEKLKQMEKMKKTIEEYSNVSGITNHKILQKFIDLQIPLEIVASLAVIPLIEIAWADGKIDEQEKKMVLNSITSLGIEKTNIEHELIERWLEHKPDQKLLDAWKSYIHGICEQITQEEKKQMEEELLKHVYSIAEASGGILNTGIGNKVSNREQELINQLQSAFT